MVFRTCACVHVLSRHDMFVCFAGCDRCHAPRLVRINRQWRIHGGEEVSGIPSNLLEFEGDRNAGAPFHNTPENHLSGIA